VHLLETYAFSEAEDMGGGSHCVYKNVSCLNLGPYLDLMAYCLRSLSG